MKCSPYTHIYKHVAARDMKYWSSNKLSIIVELDGFSHLYKCDWITPDDGKKIFCTKKKWEKCWTPYSVVFEPMLRMDTSKEKITHILKFFFDKGGAGSRNVNSFYAPDTLTVNHAEFWYPRYFTVWNSWIENVDQIMEVVESDHHAVATRLPSS